VRVVEPPLWGGTAEAEPTRRKCTWTVYKSLEAIPDWVYRRVGHTRPQLPVLPPAAAPGADAQGGTDASTGDSGLEHE
jgi:hypothetical protein